jgi:predicted flap endonuclease-1-like 5' DNA nuclease
MLELIDEGLAVGEVGIFLFEIGDFSPIQKSADLVKEHGHELMNSLKFNEVDWTIVVKKLDPETAKARAEKIAEAKREAEEAARRAEEEAKRKAEEAAKKAEEEAKRKAEEEAKAKAEAEAKAKAEAEAKAKAEEEAKKKAEEKAKAEAEAKAAEETAKKAEKDNAGDAKKSKTENKPAKKGSSKKKEIKKGDDLTVIKGIGKAYMEKLNAEGIYTIEEVANMNAEQVRMMEEKYSFKGDFKESVADAKKLLKKKAK